MYVALLIAMIGGRVLWGTTMYFLLGFDYNKFGIASFWTGAVVNALPGIIIQIILIPVIVILLSKGNYIGAIKQMEIYQEEYDSFIFVADMHAITVPQERVQLMKNIIKNLRYSTTFKDKFLQCNTNLVINTKDNFYLLGITNKEKF